MENTEKLIIDLKKTKKMKNIRLAKRMWGIFSSTSFVVKKDGPKMRKNEKDARKLLYSLFDEKTLELMRTYDRTIDELVERITCDGPWHYSEYFREFSYRDNFTNMHDPEFRDWDTYTVVRRENGFEPYDEDPYNGYFEKLLNTETRFIEKHKEDLDQLHKTLILREHLLSCSFGVKDEKDRELARELIYFIGLLKEPKSAENSFQYNK